VNNHDSTTGGSTARTEIGGVVPEQVAAIWAIREVHGPPLTPEEN